MASFAKIGLNNKVIEVISINNEVLKDSSGVEREELGIQFLNELTGWPIWKQTSYNTRGGQHYLPDNSKLSNTQEKAFRKNHAGIGYTYDEDRDAFISKKPFNSWVLNENTCIWEAPIAKPDINNIYNWNESTQSWDLIS
jgi:hypothetical protein